MSNICQVFVSFNYSKSDYDFINKICKICLNMIISKNASSNFLNKFFTDNGVDLISQLRNIILSI